MRLLSLFAFSSVLFFAQGAFAYDSKIDRIVSQLEKVQNFGEVSISPDGREVIWSETDPSSGDTALYLLERNTTAAKPTRINAKELGVSPRARGISWSPSGKQFAFLASLAGQEQVMVADVALSTAHRVTNLKGYVTDVRWSPDSRQLAFLYAENGGGGGPLEAVPAQTGAIGSDIHNQRLTVMAADGGALRPLSPPELNIYEYDWSPGADRFAAIAAPGPADNNWWTAKLYDVDAHSGTMKLVYTPPAERQITVPRWSPDGKRIGFIGGLMSDEGFIGGDIFLISKEGGEARDLTPAIAASPSGFSWRSDSEIIFTEALDGGGAISTLDLAGGRIEMIWKGGQSLHQDGNYPNFALAKDGRTSAAIRGSWEQAPEIWTGPIGGWTQITHANSDQKPHWGKAESVVWKSDSLRVQGWLIYPERFDPSKRYPLVVEIHGGPAGVRSAAWPTVHFDMSVMAGLGYFVFFPNPRGSYGEGEEFTRANVKDFGAGDLRDILAGIDEVEKKVPVNESRIGVTGWSYGGFMTMWTVTQTNRFRAAVAGAGIADWLSYYGENSIDEWMIPYFGASVYDDPAVYAKSSPITFIKQVKTPTLVVVGERDGECPAPQSFEFWHALKSLDVPTQLVVYAGEGHSFRDAKDRVDVLKRTLAWFDQYLGK